MITVNRVTKTYSGVPAVRDATFSVPPACVVGLLGPNGAGKSTLMRMMTAYLAPTAGDISVMGHDTIRHSPAARAAIGYLPESTPCYPEMTPASYLRFRASLFSIPRRKRRAAIDRAIEQCWLAPVHSRRISALSKGYRQRVGLAAALLHDPPVLILDEPSAGLDPAQAHEMRALIRSLAATRAVLISSHILTEVERICDRVVIIARGTILADSTPSHLLTSSRREYIVEYRFLSSHPTDPHRALHERLARLPAVLSCTPPATPPPHTSPSPVHRLTLAGDTAHPAIESLAESIAHTITSSGAALSELHLVRPSLESVFLRLIESDGPLPNPAPTTPDPDPEPSPSHRTAEARPRSSDAGGEAT